MDANEIAWQTAYDAEIAAFEDANLPITFGAQKIARDRADAAMVAARTTPTSQATDMIDPPSPTRPCWVCGVTDPAAHGPDDACPDLAADQAWLDAQRPGCGDRHR